MRAMTWVSYGILLKNAERHRDGRGMLCARGSNAPGNEMGDKEIVVNY